MIEDDLIGLAEALDIAEEVWVKNKLEEKQKDMEIILYTTHCPVCKGIERLLKAKHIPFKEVTDVEEMKKLGIYSAPVLGVGGKLLTGKEIHDFINSYNRG